MRSGWDAPKGACLAQVFYSKATRHTGYGKGRLGETVVERTHTDATCTPGLCVLCCDIACLPPWDKEPVLLKVVLLLLGLKASPSPAARSQLWVGNLIFEGKALLYGLFYFGGRSWPWGCCIPGRGRTLLSSDESRQSNVLCLQKSSSQTLAVSFSTCQPPAPQAHRTPNHGKILKQAMVGDHLGWRAAKRKTQWLCTCRLRPGPVRQDSTMVGSGKY